MIRRATLLLKLLLGLWIPDADAQTRLGNTNSVDALLGPSLVSDESFSYTPSPLGSGSSWQDKFMLRSLGGIEAQVLRGSHFAAGLGARSDRPGLRLNAGRDDSTMEVNAFGELFIDEWSIIGRVGQDLSEEGGGFVADLGLRWASQLTDSFRVEVGSGVSWASGSYLDRFFGVGPRESASSGLRLYDATPGLKDVSISGSVSYSLTDSWTIGGLVGAQRLLGAAASSPLVKDESEFFGGFSLDYRF